MDVTGSMGSYINAAKNTLVPHYTVGVSVLGASAAEASDAALGLNSDAPRSEAEKKDPNVTLKDLDFAHVLAAVRRASGRVLARGGCRAHLLQRAVRPQLLVVAALLPHGQVVDRLEVLLVLGADRGDVRLAHADVLRLEHRVQLLALAVVLGRRLLRWTAHGCG